MSNKIVFGSIVRNLVNTEPYLSFIKNAEKFGHKISALIIGYNVFADELILEELNRYCKTLAFKMGDIDSFSKSFPNCPLSKNELSVLIGEQKYNLYEKLSYGTMRNNVVLAALTFGADFLLFFDDDVSPKVLMCSDKNTFEFQEIDFVGSHVSKIKDNDEIVATTSDYTGFYIIPHIDFPNLEDLLFGLQKENVFSFISSEENKKPICAQNISRNIRLTTKILGGNLCLDLRELEFLPPFFSSILVMGGNCYLGRGEDTLFAPIVTKFKKKCLDIDLPIFHNCYGDFPNKPDFHHQKNLDRFYLACLGWTIRNPFMNWIRKNFQPEFDLVDDSERYKKLVAGSEAISEYLNDYRFMHLPVSSIMSQKQLKHSIARFNTLINNWKKVQKVFSRS